ncbi:twitching motility protein PilT, partial [Pelomonas sp. HMWF004]
MSVYDGSDPKAVVERKVRDAFMWAALSKCSDIHFVGRGDSQKPEVTLTIRNAQGALVHEVYTGEHGKHFATKLLQLAGVPQGGSTPPIVSTRFDLRLPLEFAKRHGLAAREGKAEYEVDVRLEYAKTHDGFTFVCRLLDQESSPRLDEMGFTGALQGALLRALHEPSGMILATGPTGSGKTTLLKAMIDYLNDGTRAISTVEDPVELKIGTGSVKQIQVGGDITFSKALRSILRQDPDVVMIGEIRDAETMEIAIQAAQTGHLVLSTLHTNSAHESIGRAISLLTDKERDVARLAETLKFVMAQRLLPRHRGPVRERALSHAEQQWMALNGIAVPARFAEVVPEAKAGRTAIVESIYMADDIKMALREDHPKDVDIYRLARSQDQYESLAAAGLRAVESKGVLLRD